MKIEPKHADANIALGAYHANVVNKMGGLAARLTFGASKEAAVENFQAAMKLHPNSAIARIEYANGLAMLFGKAKLAEATKLYEEAAECSRPMRWNGSMWSWRNRRSRLRPRTLPFPPSMEEGTARGGSLGAIKFR